MDKQELQDLKDKYLDKMVYVQIDDPYHPISGFGRVLRVDDAGQLHGTWGGLAAIPGVDHIEIINFRKED